MKYAASALAIAGMAATVQGHGFLTSPKARMPGDAFQAACGQQVYNNQKSDNYGNIQGELQVASSQSDYNAEECKVWLCKGFLFDDNKDNVQTYTPGQKVDFKFDIRAPHTGSANVSIVDTATNSVLGSPLMSWDSFASTSSPISSDQTSFSITIPSDLGDSCSTPGACVIQHWWDSPEVDQTYESCIDFTVGGSGSASGSSPSAAASSAPATTSVAANTQVAATSSAATPTTSAASATSATATAAASSVSSGSSSVPQDFELQDVLDWITYLYNKGETTYTASNAKAKRHPRDFRA